MKRTIAIMVIALICTGLFALSLQDMLEQAKQGSQEVKRYEISLSRTLSTLNEQDASQGLSLSINSSSLTWDDSDTPLSLTPSASLSYKTEDDVTLALDGSGAVYLGSDLAISGSAAFKASASKAFELSSAASASDLTKVKSKLQAQLSYDQSMIRFETTFYQAVQAIVKQQSAVSKAQKSLDKAQKALDDALLLGTYTEGSLSWQSARLQIDYAQATLDNAKVSLDNLIEAFRRDYGFEYENPDSLEAAELYFDGSTSNTALYIAKLTLDIAQASYDESIMDSRSLSVGGSLSGRYASSTPASTTAAAELAYSASGLSLALSGNLSYSSGSWSPSITLTGSYKTSVADQAEAIRQERLLNDLAIAQMDYQDSLWEAEQSARQLLADIADHEVSIAQQQAQVDYVQRSLEQQQKLLELGLVTASSVEDARSSVEDELLNLESLKLSGLILENSIRLFCL